MGPVQLVGAINKLQSQMASCAAAMCQAAAAAAMTGDQSFVGDCRKVYQQRSEKAVELLNRIPGLRCLPADGTFYVYPSCKGVIGKRTPDGKAIETDTDFTLYLLESEGVSVVAGSAYGLSPYFRVSVATSMDVIEEGCSRIARACAALR